MIGYFLGLTVTIFTLMVTKEPQPALLFILPTMIAFYIIQAFLKKEMLKMLAYDEDEELAKFNVKIQ